MRIFIVHAHHEPTSFNGAMTAIAVSSLRAAGHEVVVSDLYAMSFDPVSDRRNFKTIREPGRLKQQNEESRVWRREVFQQGRVLLQARHVRRHNRRAG